MELQRGYRVTTDHHLVRTTSVNSLLKKDLNTTRLRRSTLEQMEKFSDSCKCYKQDWTYCTPARKTATGETECNTGHADCTQINPTSSHGNHSLWSNERSNRKDQVGSHLANSAEIWEGRHHRWERCGVQTENETEQRRQKHRTRKTSARWLCVGQAREKKLME